VQSFHESEYSGASEIEQWGRRLAIRCSTLFATSSARYRYTTAYLEQSKYLYLVSKLCGESTSRSDVMASFTRIEESESASITINPSHKIAKVDDNIYGGFTE